MEATPDPSGDQRDWSSGGPPPDAEDIIDPAEVLLRCNQNGDLGARMLELFAASLPSELEKIEVAAVRGTDRKSLIARVASRKVNRPKVASFTSHFMKLEMAVSSPNRHCGGTSRIQPGIVSGSANETSASAAKPIQIALAADILIPGERSPTATAAVMTPPCRRPAPP